MLPVANRALIVHALDALQRAGVKHVAVWGDPALARPVRGALGEAGLGETSVSWVDRGASAGLLGLLRFADGDPVAVHLADSLTHSCLAPLLEAPEGNRDATLVVERGTHDGRVVDLARRRQGVASGTSGTAADPAGVWVLGSEVLKGACELDAETGFEACLMAAIEREQRRGGRLTTLEVTDWWRYRDCPDVLLDANRFALEGLNGAPVTAILVDTRIQGPVLIDRSARLESSVVRGPAVIGAGAGLRDAYVGPYSSIGQDVMIEGAEIEHSIILPGASVRHLSTRLEASIVGPRARVFRDFRLPKALRLQVGEGAEISLA